MADAVELRDRLIDELVWAIDHAADSRRDLRREAAAIIDRARAHVAAWHTERLRHVIGRAEPLCGPQSRRDDR
jgi:hypothetical protein